MGPGGNVTEVEFLYLFPRFDGWRIFWNKRTDGVQWKSAHGNFIDWLCKKVEELRRLLQETNEQQAVLALNTRFNFFTVLLLTNDLVKQIEDDCCCCPPVLFNAQLLDGSLSNQYQVIFECVSGQSSYFSCNVASLFWRQDLWGIFRNLHLLNWPSMWQDHLTFHQNTIIWLSSLTSPLEL